VLFVLLFLMTLCPIAVAQPGRPGQPFQPNRPGQPFQPNRPGQPYQPGTPSDAQKAGAAACGGMAILIAIVSVVLAIGSIALWVFVAIWAANDAKARGMDNSALWVVLILFTGVIGLIVYIVSRPQGNLYACDDCGKKRLRESRKCPHCRAA
jgi:hypothetical protein